MFNRSIFLLLIFITTSLQSNFAYAELKIGVYDNRAILDSLPIVQKELDKLSAEFEPKKQDLESKQKKLLSLQQDFEKNAPVLSPEEVRAKQLEYQSKRRELQLLAEDTDREFNVRRNEIARKIQASVEQEVIKYAEEQSYDMVLRSGVIFAGAKVDITKQILERLSDK